MADPRKEDVLECYRLAREFLKGGAKANNKVYDPAVAPEKAQQADLRIAGGSALTGAGARALFPAHTIGYGQVMRETGNTFGNCSESTGLAASYAAQLMPNVKLTAIYAKPGDHAFLVVGWMPSGRLAVNDLASAVPEQRDSYVIDVWAGICCHTRVFPTRLEAKMQQWEQDGKRVVVVMSDNRTIDTMRPTEWGQAVGISRMKRLNPHQFGTAEHLQALRDHMTQARTAVMRAVRKDDLKIRQQRRTVSDELKQLETQPRDYLREEREHIDEMLRGQLKPEDRVYLEQRLRLLRTDKRAYLSQSKQELTQLRQTVSEQQSVVERKLQYLGTQQVRNEPPVPPLVRRRITPPAVTGAQAAQPAPSANPQLDDGGGRRQRRRSFP